MTQISDAVAPCSVAAAEARKIYAEHPPLSREQAAEMLAAKGWTIGSDGKPVWKPKA
jgi:hypothetical protein